MLVRISRLRVVVTGAAGFIGSHLTERLLADGHDVVGIDCFTDYYARSRKEANLEVARASSSFTFHDIDLAEANLAPLLEGAEIIYHLAGQPGVRPSWGSQFDRYVRDNIVATQRLLEALKGSDLKKLVYAGSSSVYGDAEVFPTTERALPAPLSPYGVTKLAGEHLAYLYWKNFDIPANRVRYFTVYGPRQRPDMGFPKFMRAIADGETIEVYGDGEQTREFTYISDAVDGTVRAGEEGKAGELYNLGGGSSVTLNHVFELLAEVSGKEVKTRHVAPMPGDHRKAGASITLARQRLHWEPRVSLKEGLKKQWEWFLATSQPMR